jgi:GDPmannose 4,6-dehydratase
MWRMLQQPTADDYVIATGTTHTIRDLLDVAFARIGISDWSPYVSYDAQYERPAEVDLLIGDASKAKRVLGWEPRVAFSELIEMMVDADLAEQKEQG